MTHFEGRDRQTLRSLRELTKVTSVYAAEDRLRSWIAVLTTALLLFAALGAAAASSLPILMRMAGSAAAALLFIRMFVIYHDFEHGAILRNSPAARVLLSTFGLLILSPPSIWNRLHNYHHSHNCQFVTSGIGSFPVMTVREYRAATPWARAGYRWLRSPAMMVAAYLSVFVTGFCLKSVHDDGKRHWDSAVALGIHAALLVAYARMGWLTLGLGLIAPMWLAHAAGAYLFYAQHNFPDVRLQPRQQWDYVYAAVYSSSFMDCNRFIHWVTGNIGYHNVHHLNSKIPFYRLPEAMMAIPELRESGRTTLHPRDIRACLALKLWDEQQSRMVGYPAL